MSDKETAEDAVDTGEKRKRGRPKNPKPDTPQDMGEPKEKRPRGRPKGSFKKNKKKAKPQGPKKPGGGRGRPRKDAGEAKTE